MWLSRHEPRCLDCAYSLKGLESMRCPECGRGFDPADAATYSAQTLDSRRLLVRAILGFALCLMMVLGLLVGFDGSDLLGDQSGTMVGVFLSLLSVVWVIGPIVGWVICMDVVVAGWNVIGRRRASATNRGELWIGFLLSVLPASVPYILVASAMVAILLRVGVGI